MIRGKGKAFCAGLELSSDGLQDGAEDMVVRMFDKVQHYPLPVVARVHGPAIAGGCELALHCDFIVASMEAPFGMPLAQLGVTTDWFLTKKIMETMGLVAERELLLLGDFIPARAFHANGHIARAVPASELDAETNKIVQRLSANAPLKADFLQQAKANYPSIRAEQRASQVGIVGYGFGFGGAENVEPTEKIKQTSQAERQRLACATGWKPGVGGGALGGPVYGG